MNRRFALGLLAAGAASFSLPTEITAQTTTNKTSLLTLPKLPYSFDALEPYIDAQTMQIHYEKHHAAYVENANKALAKYPNLLSNGPEALLQNINLVPADVREAVKNHVGGHVNHSLYWQTLKKGEGQKPKAELAIAIDYTFKNLEGFLGKFSEATSKVFGSGWAWLVLDPKSQLMITTTPNQNSPWMENQLPLLGIDVWEHAYYLKHQNRRADYIKAFTSIINWDFVSDLYAEHSKKI
jgi:Fe-Mn family superoxide dismutase